MTKDDIDDSAAPLVEHLIELRNRLIWSVAAFLIAMILCFFVAEPILDFLLGPIEKSMRELGDPNPVMQYTAPQEYFFVAGPYLGRGRPDGQLSGHRLSALALCGTGALQAPKSRRSCRS